MGQLGVELSKLTGQNLIEWGRAQFLAEAICGRPLSERRDVLRDLSDRLGIGVANISPLGRRSIELQDNGENVELYNPWVVTIVYDKGLAADVILGGVSRSGLGLTTLTYVDVFGGGVNNTLNPLTKGTAESLARAIAVETSGKKVPRSGLDGSMVIEVEMCGQVRDIEIPKFPLVVGFLQKGEFSKIPKVWRQFEQIFQEAEREQSLIDLGAELREAGYEWLAEWQGLLTILVGMKRIFGKKERLSKYLEALQLGFDRAGLNLGAEWDNLEQYRNDFVLRLAAVTSDPGAKHEFKQITSGNGNIRALSDPMDRVFGHDQSSFPDSHCRVTFYLADIDGGGVELRAVSNRLVHVREGGDEVVEPVYCREDLSHVNLDGNGSVHRRIREGAVSLVGAEGSRVVADQLLQRQSQFPRLRG